MVTYRQVGVALALALFVPAVVAGGSASSGGTGTATLVAGHAAYGELVVQTQKEEPRPRLLGYFECKVAVAGIEFTPEGPLREWLCPDHPTVYITSSDAADPRGRVRTPTGNDIEIAPLDGLPVPPVREYVYRDDSGRVQHAWGVEVGETRLDPQTGRPYNFVGSVDVAKLPAGLRLRAWTEADG